MSTSASGPGFELSLGRVLVNEYERGILWSPRVAARQPSRTRIGHDRFLEAGVKEELTRSGCVPVIVDGLKSHGADSTVLQCGGGSV